MPRLACAAILLALGVAGCGSDTKTVTETQPATQATSTAGTKTVPKVTATIEGQNVPLAPAGNHGPHYFQTPSKNIGCYLSAHDVRCDIRERDWTPPPEPKSCIKIGLDYGQGLVVGQHGAEFVCAGDTTLGGPGLLGYGHSARRGSIYCVSRQAGITCVNDDNGHGFFLSRARYRLF
jgi:Family of unknown function (DUF6636)